MARLKILLDGILSFRIYAMSSIKKMRVIDTLIFLFLQIKTNHFDENN